MQLVWKILVEEGLYFDRDAQFALQVEVEVGLGDSFQLPEQQVIEVGWTTVDASVKS